LIITTPEQKYEKNRFLPENRTHPQGCHTAGRGCRRSGVTLLFGWIRGNQCGSCPGSTRQISQTPAVEICIRQPCYNQSVLGPTSLRCRGHLLNPGNNLPVDWFREVYRHRNGKRS